MHDPLQVTMMLITFALLFWLRIEWGSMRRSDRSYTMLQNPFHLFMGLVFGILLFVIFVAIIFTGLGTTTTEINIPAVCSISALIWTIYGLTYLQLRKNRGRNIYSRQFLSASLAFGVSVLWTALTYIPMLH